MSSEMFNALARDAGSRDPVNATNAKFKQCWLALMRLAPSIWQESQLTLWTCLFLALVTFGLYWPSTGHQFINLDDNFHIYQNSHVLSGLTWSSLAWAFRTTFFCTWHPLTWISYMLDYQLYGLNPAGFHLTNILFHTANTLLLFLLLKGLTGRIWPSAFVAAAFAWHPLRVESVAWVVERKDVMSTFFFLLTLMAYARYAESKVQSPTPNVEPDHPASSIQHPSSLLAAGWFYGLALAFFACALMSKAMVVTLPFVLLLLDYWPLHRFQLFNLNAQRSTVGRLLVEKLPFFLLAVVASLVTLHAADSAAATSVLGPVAASTRLANALVSYVRYISKTFWPADLAVLYTYPAQWPVSIVLGAALLLASWSVLFLLKARSHPYLIVGWCWFLGTLVPTIGVVQAGFQSMADRFTYIPSIGLFLLLAWLLSDLSRLSEGVRKICRCSAVVTLVGFLLFTPAQLQYWHDSLKLFAHAAQVTTDNYFIYEKLGEVLNDSGQKELAARAMEEAVRLCPTWPKAQYNLGTLFLADRRYDEAVPHLSEAVRLDPSDLQAQMNLGVALMQLGQAADALPHLAVASRLASDNPEAHFDFGLALLDQNRPEEAVAQFGEALRLRPDHVNAHYRMALALIQLKRRNDAIVHFCETLRLAPDFTEARDEMACVTLTD